MFERMCRNLGKAHESDTKPVPVADTDSDSSDGQSAAADTDDNTNGDPVPFGCHEWLLGEIHADGVVPWRQLIRHADEYYSRDTHGDTEDVLSLENLTANDAMTNAILIKQKPFCPGEVRDPSECAVIYPRFRCGFLVPSSNRVASDEMERNNVNNPSWTEFLRETPGLYLCGAHAAGIALRKCDAENILDTYNFYMVSSDGVVSTAIIDNFVSECSMQYSNYLENGADCFRLYRSQSELTVYLTKGIVAVLHLAPRVSLSELLHEPGLITHQVAYNGHRVFMTSMGAAALITGCEIVHPGWNGHTPNFEWRCAKAFRNGFGLVLPWLDSCVGNAFEIGGVAGRARLQFTLGDSWQLRVTSGDGPIADPPEFHLMEGAHYGNTNSYGHIIYQMTLAAIVRDLPSKMYFPIPQADAISNNSDFLPRTARGITTPREFLQSALKLVVKTKNSVIQDNLFTKNMHIQEFSALSMLLCPVSVVAKAFADTLAALYSGTAVLRTNYSSDFMRDHLGGVARPYIEAALFRYTTWCDDLLDWTPVAARRVAGPDPAAYYRDSKSAAGASAASVPPISELSLRRPETSPRSYAEVAPAPVSSVAALALSPECSLCESPIQPSESNTMVLSCRHAFHIAPTDDCVGFWVWATSAAKNGRCPKCREPVVPESDSESSTDNCSTEGDSEADAKTISARKIGRYCSYLSDFTSDSDSDSDNMLKDFKFSLVME
jgi:hypothetical protein